MSRGQGAWPLLLAVTAVASALGVVHAKYDSRRLFVELQGLREQRDQLDTEWGRLQLELGTLGEHSRVEKKARERLAMRPPKPEEVVVISPRP